MRLEVRYTDAIVGISTLKSETLGRAQIDADLSPSVPTARPLTAVISGASKSQTPFNPTSGRISSPLE
ncbi:MAG: hypothetical protein ABW166_10770 [Sedimenticola sp.]